MTPEKKVQNAIEKYFDGLMKNGQHIFYERRSAGGFGSKKGLPDLWTTVDGQHIEIEVKAPGGKTSPLQDTWKKFFGSIGVTCVVVDSVESIRHLVEDILGK